MASGPIVGVATQKHQGESNWCRDTPSGVATWLGWARPVLGCDMNFYVAIGAIVGTSRPSLWRRYMEAAW